MTITVTDEMFAKAIALIDSGDVKGLAAYLFDHPRLLRETVPLADSSAGGYFANPKLLWFVAENPVRNDALPDNIAAVAKVIIGVSDEHAAEGLQDNLDYTLGLVASGRVAREAGVQTGLIETLTNAGANASAAVTAALGHREIAAAACLLKCGAELTVQLASGLGQRDDVERLAATANKPALQEALSIAAINGEAGVAEALIRYGADPSLFNPDHLHAQTTPLHQAVVAGSLDTVQALVAGGARRWRARQVSG